MPIFYTSTFLYFYRNHVLRVSNSKLRLEKKVILALQYHWLSLLKLLFLQRFKNLSHIFVVATEASTDGLKDMMLSFSKETQ